MPEPVIGVQWRIRLHWSPAQVASAIDNIPVLEIDLAALRAHPADIPILEEADISKDERIRLIGAQIIDDRVEVVCAAGAPCTIQPELSELAIMRRQLLEHRKIVLVIGGWILVTRIVSVPRRKIDAEAQTLRPRAVRDHADQIAFAPKPWT